MKWGHWVTVIVIFLSSVFAQGYALQCGDLFFNQNPILEKALRRVGRVNPELVSEFNSLSRSEKTVESLYMILKKEGWRINPRGMIPWKDKPQLSVEVVTLIRENSPKAFDTENLSEDEVYIYYGNALQDFYISVSRIFQQAFRNQLLVGKSANNKLRDFLDTAIDHSLFPGLGSRELEPGQVHEIIDSAFNKTNWLLIVEMAQNFISENSNLGVRDWLDLQENIETLSSAERHLFIKSWDKKQNKDQHCCRNSPGCLFCPNNRSFRIP